MQKNRTNIHTLEGKAELLLNLIEEKIGVDVTQKTRDMHVVRARYIFCKILIDEGNVKSRVSKMVGKDHATVLHYMREWDGYYSSSSVLREQYTLILDSYDAVVNTNVMLTKSELLQRVDELENENLRLSLRASKYEDAADKIKFKSLHKLIDERTKDGQEELLWRRLNAIYNGI